MSELHDKLYRLQMVERYLNAETSIEEEQQLADYYSAATEPLTEEEEDVWLLLQATTKGDSDFELSGSKVAEFDRLMASGEMRQVRLWPVTGWLTAVAVSVAVLFVLFGHHPEDKTDEQQIAVVTQEEMKAEPVTEIKEVGTPAFAERRMKPTRRNTKPLKTERDNSGQAEGEVANGAIISTMMAAANIMDEQVETYHFQPAGDATIVTKTYADGTSASCIVCSMDGNEGYNVVPF